MFLDLADLRRFKAIYDTNCCQTVVKITGACDTIDKGGFLRPYFNYTILLYHL